MLKAICANDINYGDIPVFVFNPESRHFECDNLSYHFAVVMNDPTWQVYATDGELVYPIENLDRVSEEHIYALTRPEPELEEEE